MFRNFDNWDRYHDRDGKLLHGVVQFMVKDGTTESNIYDSDFTPIANPQMTDSMGRTAQQVFVAEDVLAYFYKYIGDGSLATEFANGVDTSDQSKWSLQYTVESAAIDQRSVTGESSMGVPDLDTLRSIDPTEVPEVYGHKIICLQGYYSCGDCEPVWYIWDGESTLADDNGGVIKSDERLVGRWILVQPTEHCDSRHFGVFPQDSAAADINQEVRITQLFDYCNQKSIRPYFNGSASYPYFIYDTVRVLSRNPIDVSEDVVFVDKMASTMGGDFNGNPKFQNRNTTVTCKTVRLSWQAGAYPNCQTFIIDTNYPVQLSDKKVVIEASPNNSTQLVRCQVESNHMIDGYIVMQEMELREEWFAEGYDWSKLSSYSNTLLLRNFESANTYITLKNKQHEPNYGDLGEQTVSGVTLLAGSIAENAAFSNVTIQGATELHNISGTVTVSGSNLALNAVDCWLNFTAGFVATSLAIRRGSLVCASTVQMLGDLYADNAEIHMPLMTRGHSAEFRDCKLTQRADTDYVKLVNCQIEGIVCTHGYTADSINQVNFYIDNCYFGQNGTHVIESTLLQTGVRGSWTNNYAEAQHPIQINMTNLIGADSGHPYTYNGNSGKFLKRYPVVSYTQGQFWMAEEVIRDIVGNSGAILCKTGLIIQPTHNEWFSGVWIPTRFSVSCPFFGIGVVTARMRMTVTFEFTNDTSMNDSMTPRVNHRIGVTGDMMVNVNDAANYSCTDFNGRFLGGIFLGPKNYQYPAEITTATPSTWPQTNTAHITVERLL